MRDSKCVVVGVDFSESSRSALGQALDISSRTSSRLVVVHVIDEDVIERAAEAMNTSEDELRVLETETVSRKLSDFLPSGVDTSSVDIEVRIGHPLDQILGLVSETNAGLLVLGATGLGENHGLGSLAGKCCRKVPAEVLLVRRNQPGPHKKVVVGVDFSETSRRAVKWGVEISGLDSASLRVVHVYFGPWHQLHYMSPTTEADPDFIVQYKQTLRDRLQEFLIEYRDRLADQDVKCELVEYSSPSAGLVKYVEENGTDLVVIGTRGRSKLSYLLMGSDAERIAGKVGCSVLLVKPEGFKTPS